MALKHLLSVLAVTLYILHCFRIATRPWKYYQLNVDRFNSEKGIFSKIDIDRGIPDEWRLDQCYDDGVFVPAKWPVFVKPEWGQNAAGVRPARSMEELQEIREQIRGSRVCYLVQSSAPEPREFEVFSIRHHACPSRYAILTVTETVNTEDDIPINGVFNPHSRYLDLTDSFDPQQLEALWAMSNRLGNHVICRVSYRADSPERLVLGRVHVIEVNLYLPMPINLLDRHRPLGSTLRALNRYMVALAWATKRRDRSRPDRPVYLKTNLYHCKHPLLHRLRDWI